MPRIPVVCYEGTGTWLHGGCMGTGILPSHPFLWFCLPQLLALPPAPLRLLPGQELALCLLPLSLHAAIPQGQTPDVSPQCQSYRVAIFTQHRLSAKHVLSTLYCSTGLYLLPILPQFITLVFLLLPTLPCSPERQTYTT